MEIIQKIMVKETMRSMEVGDEFMIPLENIRAAKVAAWGLPAKFHVYRLKNGVKVIRYE